MNDINLENIDLNWRPDTYWPESQNRDQLLSHIKGQARREITRQALDSGGLAVLNDIGPDVASEVLSDPGREGWGSIHPSLMGGEYLPEYEDSEVEIIRISLDSVTADQISILAGGVLGDIQYRIVDEYDTEYEPSITKSEQPLSLGELIRLLDETDNPFNGEEGGLVRNHWEHIGQVSGAEEGIEFVSVRSAFYKQLASYYSSEASRWLALQLKEE